MNDGGFVIAEFVEAGLDLLGHFHAFPSGLLGLKDDDSLFLLHLQDTVVHLGLTSFGLLLLAVGSFRVICLQLAHSLSDFLDILST